MADTRVQSKYLDVHSVAAGAKDAAAPTVDQLKANPRFDSLLSVQIELAAGAANGTVAVTMYCGDGNGVGENQQFGLAGKQVFAYVGNAVAKTFLVPSHGKKYGFYVDDDAGGNINPACTIKVSGSSEN